MTAQRSQAVSSSFIVQQLLTSGFKSTTSIRLHYRVRDQTMNMVSDKKM